MGVLKGLGLSFLSFLLVLCLTIFGFAFMLNSTVLNPDFIATELDSIDVSSIVREVLEEESSQDPDFPEELRSALLTTIEGMEPVIKQQVSAAVSQVGDYLRGKTDDPELALVLRNTFFNQGFVVSLLDEVDMPALLEASVDPDMPQAVTDAALNIISRNETEIKAQAAAAADPIFEYLLSQSDTLDLAQTLRDTLLSTDFVTALLDELDITELASDFLNDELSGQLPAGVELPAAELHDIVSDLEPAIKQAMRDYADPILDYLLGLRPSVSLTVSLEGSTEVIEAALTRAFLSNPPLGWNALPPQEQDRLLDEFLDEAMRVVPSTFEFDEALLGSDLSRQMADTLNEAQVALDEARQGISEGLAEAEDGLAEARLYVGYFLAGYWALIGLMVVLVLGIILMHHQVKDASRHLGIIFLAYGLIELAGALLGRYLALAYMPLADLPQSLQELPQQLLNDFTGPLLALSIGLAVGGVVLIAVSVIYPRLRPGTEEI